MRIAILICCILALALLVLLGLSYTPSLKISVTEVYNGVIIQNLGNVGCPVFVRSPEGEQQFEVAVGKTVMVTDISQPIEVSVSPTAGWVHLEKGMALLILSLGTSVSDLTDSKQS